MEPNDKIPTSKIERAAKLAKTGLQVGGNYIKHYSKKLINQESTKEDLHKQNADVIFESLSEMKGSVLKVLQVLSMDKNVLPTAYIDKFSMAQHKAPPLSAPLLIKTFKEYVGKKPNEIFDVFETTACNAASFGQVHKAELGGKKLAVKVQYPGVGDSVISDIKMAKPFAVRLLNLKEKDLQKYFLEVEARLQEETDYLLEVKRGTHIMEKCAAELPQIAFAKYYPEFSGKKVITMDWLEGTPLLEFPFADNPEAAHRIGQDLWDFYDFQIHDLKMTHADPHPGNFMITPDLRLAVLDFGCVKEIPLGFYNDYFELIQPKNLADDAKMLSILRNIEIVLPEDKPDVIAFYMNSFRGALSLLAAPFYSEEFDFSDEEYFKKIFASGESFAKEADALGYSSARGSQHILYMNRTCFGLFSILNQMKVKIKTRSRFFDGLPKD